MPEQNEISKVTKMCEILENPQRTLSERFRALFALKNFGGTQSIDSIARCFVDSSVLLKHELAYCLGQMQNAYANDILISVLKDVNQGAMVRHEAGEALGAIGSLSAIGILEQYVDDPVPEVAETCQLAVERIKWLQKKKSDESIFDSSQSNITQNSQSTIFKSKESAFSDSCGQSNGLVSNDSFKSNNQCLSTYCIFNDPCTNNIKKSNDSSLCTIHSCTISLDKSNGQYFNPPEKSDNEYLNSSDKSSNQSSIKSDDQYFNSSIKSNEQYFNSSIKSDDQYFNIPTNSLDDHQIPYKSIDPAPPSKEKDVSILKQCLLDEKETMFNRYRAMFALRNVGSIPAVDALAQGLKCGSTLFRHEIAYVLGQLQHPHSVEALSTCLADITVNAMVRHECAEALGSIADERCTSILKSYLTDEQRVVKESCEVALDMAEYENSTDLEFSSNLI